MNQKELTKRLSSLPVGSSVRLEFTPENLLPSLEIIYKAVVDNIFALKEKQECAAFMYFAEEALKEDSNLSELWMIWEGKFKFTTGKIINRYESEKLSSLVFFAKKITIRKKRRNT